MNLSREAMLALERHFVGALSAPARTWLEPVPASQFAFAGSAVRARDGGCAVDFGTVDSPGRDTQLVRVANRGPHSVDVYIGDHPAWLAVRWRDAKGDAVPAAAGAAGETLELVAVHDAEKRFDGFIRFLVNDRGTPRIEELPVRMTARRAYPIAHLDFNGSPIPRPFDLGNGARPYRLAVANSSSVPLVVRFADLPPWLIFEVSGQRRHGPMAGPFFERRAPFTIHLWARAAGRHEGVLRIETNDPRPQYRAIALQLSATVDAPALSNEPEKRHATSITTVRKSLPAPTPPVPVQKPPQPKPVITRVEVICAVAVLLLIVFVLVVRGVT
jgi:hypothetical protein